ncbi:HDHD1 family protein [Megaselia abdita]
MSSKKSDFSKVTHVIFDMDGLLLDTERLYTVAYNNVLSQFGQKFNWDIKIQLMGMHHLAAVQKVIEDLSLPISVDDFSKQLKGHQDVLMPEAKLLPGAEKLIRHLHASKVPFALATSSGQEMVDIKTQNHKELFDLFGHKVCGSTDPEVKQGKPHPDIFLVAAERFPDKPKPECCLVFEDAPNGVTAGKAAGMQTVMVPDEHIPRDMTSHATLVLKSLEEFKPEEFGLPPFKC